MATYSNKTAGYAMSYDIVILGDAGVGKTSFLRRHIDGDFEPLYMATLNRASPVELMFLTNYGLVRLRVTDTAGQEKFASGAADTAGQEKFASGAADTAGQEKFASGPAGPDGFDGAVYMYDVTNRRSYRALYQWLPTSVPAVLCANKSDIKHRKIRLVLSNSSPFFAYYIMSAKSQHNFEKPFLALMRKLSGFNDLEII